MVHIKKKILKKKQQILEVHSRLNRYRTSISGAQEVEFLTSTLCDSEVQ